MNMDICVVGTSNQVFIKERFLNWNKIFKKPNYLLAKNPFFVIGPFCIFHFICLNILASDMPVLYENDGFSILVISIKKQYFSFLKKVFVFQKICFKVKVLKMFNIFTDCHEHADLTNGGIFSLVPFFRRIYALSVGFTLKPPRKSVFDHIFQTSDNGIYET